MGIAHATIRESETSIRIAGPNRVIIWATAIPINMLPTTNAPANTAVRASEWMNPMSVNSLTYCVSPTGSNSPVNNERTLKLVNEAITNKTNGKTINAAIMTSAGAAIIALIIP